MKIVDPMVTYVKREFDVFPIIKTYFPDYQPDGNVLCPHHGDSNASLHINPDGQGNCFGCDLVFGNIFDLVYKVNNMDSYAQARRSVYKQLARPVRDSLVKAHVRCLWKNEDAIEYLTGPERNLTEATIRKYKLGLDPACNRITIPITDAFQCVRNIRQYDWTKQHESKMISIKGYGTNRLYPEHIPFLHKRFLLVAGEFDMMVADQFGIPAVTWTNGEQSWNKQYAWMFEDKDVWVCYDADTPGRKATKETAYRLNECHPRNVVLLHPPVPEEGKDITEWSLQCPERLQQLSKNMEDKPLPKSTTKEELITCPQCKGHGYIYR